MGDTKDTDSKVGGGARPAPAMAKRPVKDEGPHPHLGPNLISNDRSVPSMTLYLEIAAVTTGGAPMLGVFVPKGGRVWQTDWAIDKIWSHFTFPIREQLNASRQQYILVAPTLGAADEAGQMKTHPDIVLDQAMAGLAPGGEGYLAAVLRALKCGCHFVRRASGSGLECRRR